MYIIFRTTVLSGIFEAATKFGLRAPARVPSPPELPFVCARVFVGGSSGIASSVVVLRVFFLRYGGVLGTAIHIGTV